MARISACAAHFRRGEDSEEEVQDPRFMSRKERLRLELTRVIVDDSDWRKVETRELFGIISKASIGIDASDSHAGASLLQLSPYDVASQLTLLMHNYGYALLSAACLTSSDRRKTNLGMRITMRFFEVCSTWPQVSIFGERKDSVSKRIHILGYFVDVCVALRDLRNYHALFALVGGMTSPCMDWLWRKAHRKDVARFEPIKRVIGAGNNYRVYRADLSKCVGMPQIYIGMCTRLLMLLEESFPVYHATDSKLINFERCRKIRKVVKEYLSAQNIEYNIDPNPEYQKAIIASMAQADVDQDVAVVLSKIAYKEHKGRRGERTFHKVRLGLGSLP